MSFRYISPKFLNSINPTAVYPFIGHLTAVVGQLVLLKLIAILTDPHVFGQFALILAIGGIVNMFLYGPLTQWAVRFYREYEETGNLSEFYSILNSFAVVSILLVIFSGLILQIFGLLKNVRSFGLDADFVIIGLVYGFVTGLNELFTTLFNASLKRKASSLFMVSASWLRVLVVCILYAFSIIDLGNIVAGLVLVLLTLLLIQVVYARLYINFEFCLMNIWYFNGSNNEIRKLIRPMIAYTLPFIIWAVPAYLVSQGDKWMLASYQSTKEVGIYAAMILSTTGLVGALVAAFNKALVPVLFHLSGASIDSERIKKAHKVLKTSISFMILCFFVLLAIYYLFPDQIITLLSSSEYLQYSNYLWLLMVAATAFHVSQLLINYGLILKTPWRYVPVKVVHGVLALALLFYLVPQFGLLGAVYSILLANVVNLLLVIATNRNLGKRTV